MEYWSLSTNDEAKSPLVDDCLVGGGKMGKLVRSIDWSKPPF